MKIVSKDTRQKMRLAKLKNPTQYWLGKKRDSITREKISKANLGNKKNLGRHHSEEENQKQSECMKKLWLTPIYRARVISDIERQTRSQAAKKRWENLDYRTRVVTSWRHSLKTSLTKPELILDQLLTNILPNKYKFVGDGTVIIQGFNPDFICRSQSKIIEMYGDFWHSLTGEVERHRRRLLNYSSQGYETLVIWEHELQNLDQVRDKILNFHTQGV